MCFASKSVNACSLSVKYNMGINDDMVGCRVNWRGECLKLSYVQYINVQWAEFYTNVRLSSFARSSSSGS